QALKGRKTPRLRPNRIFSRPWFRALIPSFEKPRAQQVGMFRLRRSYATLAPAPLNRTIGTYHPSTSFVIYNLDVITLLYRRLRLYATFRAEHSVLPPNRNAGSETRRHTN